MQLPLTSTKANDAESLIHLHERLLFLCAYPPNARTLQQVRKLLNSFQRQVMRLQSSGVDLSSLDDPEVSGIAGTSVTSNFSYAIVRWLVSKYRHQLSSDWDWFEEEERWVGTTMRRLLLLLEEAVIEEDVAYYR